MDIRKASDLEKRKRYVCCIKGCENIAIWAGSDSYHVTFFRFGKFWKYERRFCEKHKELMHSAEWDILIDKKKRTWVKPYYCGCGRQATKSLRGILSTRRTIYIEGYGRCEKCYKEDFNAEAEKEVEELLDGCKESVRKNLKNIVGLIDVELIEAQAEKESEDVVMTEDGGVYKVKFDEKKIH